MKMNTSGDEENTHRLLVNILLQGRVWVGALHIRALARKEHTEGTVEPPHQRDDPVERFHTPDR